MTQFHGGQVLAQRLLDHGVRRVFSVPGESFLALLDGLHNFKIDNIVCRQEGGAAMMAEAYGKMTGKPGVLFVTRGPGATNASSGLHVAMHDATPVVCFVGQVPMKHRDRGVFQEVNYRAFFGSLVKWVAEVETPERIAEYVDRAFAIAQSGRPGPVVVALPEDILSGPSILATVKPGALPELGAHDDSIYDMTSVLQSAKRPMIVCGGSRWSPSIQALVQNFAERLCAPLAVTFRRQDYIDNAHPCYAGDLGVGANPALGKRLSEADVILLLGAELNDITTGNFSRIDTDNPPTILQVHPDPDITARPYPLKQALTAHPGDVIERMVQSLAEGPSEDHGAEAARVEYEAWQKPQETPGSVKLEQIVLHLNRTARTAIITNGAGNYAAFLHRYFRYRRLGSQLAPTSGSMGYGLPAAISAKLEHPNRPVICFTGDGCLQMTINELSTAAQYGTDIIVIVANNGRYGTIRMHQEAQYPGRVSGTDLFNPDYVTLAAAYGGTGHIVTKSEAFPDVFAMALDGGLHIIDLRLDPRMLSTTRNL